MNVEKWIFGFGLALVFAGQSIYAQQAEADRKLLADIRANAERGDAQSQCLLGEALMVGKIGVAKDEVEAIKWFRKAAEQNYSESHYNLGVAYAGGKGVTKDEAEAVNYWRKAADQNHANSQYNLGLCYAYGRGVDRDLAEMVKWFSKAANQNHPRALHELGVCYAFGQGIAKDEAESLKCWRKAADQDNADSHYKLGLCYESGQGVPKDVVQAVTWFRKAAEQNHAQAQSSLGIAYAYGQGVIKDYLEAYKWLLLAAANGNAEARKTALTVEVLLSPEQISEGQKLARNFKPRGIPSNGGDASGKGNVNSLPEFSGSGFFITEDGYLVTNQHVVEGGAKVQLLTEAGLLPAKVVKVDPANDLALLKVDGKFAALPVASSRAVKLGATVATVGFPNIGLQGFAPKLAKGEIAGLSGAQDDARHFQISTPVQPGNSGGALVDERANVVGVVVAKLSQKAALAETGALPENVNYAVKSSYLLSFLESVPAVAAKLKEVNTKDRKFEEVVKDAEKAAVLVLIY